MTSKNDVLTDGIHPSVGAVLVIEAAVAVDEMFAALEQEPWPKGLISFSTFAVSDGEPTLTFTQWVEAAAGHEFLRGLIGAEPIGFQLYRSRTRQNPPAAGCIVILSVEFDGPESLRQRHRADTVFDALVNETEPHPGWISSHLYVSADGTRALKYVEWIDEQAHRDALERAGQETVDSPPSRQRVQGFPGIRASRHRRYQLLRSLSTARPVETSEHQEVLDSPTDWVAQHIRRYVETDGENGHLYQGWPTLLLTTRGRKSGKLRRTALIYGQDGDRYLLVASNAGSPRHPAWYLNLAADPDVTVQVHADTFAARARTATAEEKLLLWQRMASIFPRYDTYQAKASRDLPLVIVEPIAVKARGRAPDSSPPTRTTHPFAI